jgi:Ca2+-binding EF-hand superfamily protein
MDMRHILLACGLMMSITASAEPGAPRAVKSIQALDRDGDQMISLAEAEQGAPHLAARFAHLDTDNDGLLSREEIASAGPTSVRIRRNIEDDFAAADKDKDGQLSQAEAEAMPIVSDFFSDMDASKDGYVTMEEIHAHARAHGPIVRNVEVRVGPGMSEE